MKRAKTTKASRVLLYLSVGAILAGQTVCADDINLGFLSFDGFIPGSAGLPGVNEFSINNFTGDPNLGGAALPTDFPIFSFLTIQNAQLSLAEPSGNESFNLGDLGPGTTLSNLITASAAISSASLSGRLSQTTLTLSDGSTFIATSDLIHTTIVSSSGAFLNANDFSLMTVSNETTPVPEPAGWIMTVMLLMPLIAHELWVRRSRHRGSSELIRFT